jgi:thiosulfate dehydrogenase
MRAGAAIFFATLAATGCGDEIVPASELGARLFADPSLSPSPVNAFSCATCHPVTVIPPPAVVDAGALEDAPADAEEDASAPPPAPDAAAGSDRHSGPLYPGYNLYDSVWRPSWWGTNETHLLDAMNYCLVEFMGGAALDAADLRARELYEYLVSISPDEPSPALPLKVVQNITGLTELAAGADATRGQDVWSRGCRGCHGEPHSGEGRLGHKTTIVPEDTLKGPVCNPTKNPNAASDPAVRACARVVTVEKVRHGKFFNIGGLMPLYSEETLADVEIADILAYVGL